MLQIKNLPKPKNFHLQWHITDRCNWHCKHCYQTEEYLKNELDTEGLFYILNQYINVLKSWGIKGSLNVTGGEPFIRKDFFQLLEKIHENRDLIFRLGIMTNGSFITNKIARKLKELDVNAVQISLEGVKESNDEIRGKDTFEKIVRAAKILVEENIFTVISFTSTRKNYKDFPKVVELGKDIGVDRVWSDRLVPYGHGKQLQNDMLEPLEVKEFYESIHKISKKLIEEKSETRVPTYRALYFLEAEDRQSSSYICPAGESLIIIMPNGDVLPCRRMPIVVGNLMKQSLFKIWYGNEVLWKLRDMNEINSICRACEYFGRCMGGARCVTYGYCGDQFAPDPQCWKAFNKLPSPEELKSYKSENNKEFLPRFPNIYPNFTGAEPYLRIEGNSISYIGPDMSMSLNENQYLKINLENLQTVVENIIKLKPEFIVISFQLSEKDLNKGTGLAIVNFLQKLKDNKINFKIAKPLPRCLFGFEYQKMVQKFDIPKSCKDCLELFRVNKNEEIELCIGKKGPKLKYMSDRNQIYEYFEFFHDKLEINKKCKACIWFLRKQCNGLCLMEKVTSLNGKLSEPVSL